MTELSSNNKQEKSLLQDILKKRRKYQVSQKVSSNKIKAKKTKNSKTNNNKRKRNILMTFSTNLNQK